jgi:hypothetical protein
LPSPRRHGPQQDQQQSPDAVAAINKVVKHCVDVVHAMKVDDLEKQFFKKFDAYYNATTHLVENNAFLNGDQPALYQFRKCMAQEGLPLGGSPGGK